MIATNGPLDGPPVESDAEILATYGNALSRRDRVQFGSTEDMTRLELADRTGVIGGGPPKPLPIRPDAIVSPHRPPLTEPPRAARFDCAAFGSTRKHANLVDGSHVSRPFACRKCEPCREWRVFKIMVRYRHGRGSGQTRVWMWGFPDVDTARQWATAQGKRYGSSRVTLICRGTDYLFECLTIYANPISQKGEMLTRLAMRRTKRMGDINTGTFPLEDFHTLVPREPCAEGIEINPATGKPFQRRTCLFTDWPDYEKPESDYLEDDGYIETGILQTKSEATPLPGWALLRARLPLETRAALNAAEWCDVATLADYIGPSALISDTRDWADGKTAWREAYRPMYWLLYDPFVG